jgi:hypothetical protein
MRMTLKLHKGFASVSLLIAVVLGLGLLSSVYIVQQATELSSEALGGCSIVPTNEGPGCWCSDGGWQWHCGGSTCTQAQIDQCNSYNTGGGGAPPPSSCTASSVPTGNCAACGGPNQGLCGSGDSDTCNCNPGNAPCDLGYVQNGSSCVWGGVNIPLCPNNANYSCMAGATQCTTSGGVASSDYRCDGGGVCCQLTPPTPTSAPPPPPQATGVPSPTSIASGACTGPGKMCMLRTECSVSGGSVGAGTCSSNEVCCYTDFSPTATPTTDPRSPCEQVGFVCLPSSSPATTCASYGRIDKSIYSCGTSKVCCGNNIPTPIPSSTPQPQASATPKPPTSPTPAGICQYPGQPCSTGEVFSEPCSDDTGNGHQICHFTRCSSASPFTCTGGVTCGPCLITSPYPTTAPTTAPSQCSFLGQKICRRINDTYVASVCVQSPLGGWVWGQHDDCCDPSFASCGCDGNVCRVQQNECDYIGQLSCSSTIQQVCILENGVRKWKIADNCCAPHFPGCGCEGSVCKTPQPTPTPTSSGKINHECDYIGQRICDDNRELVCLLDGGARVWELVTTCQFGCIGNECADFPVCNKGLVCSSVMIPGAAPCLSDGGQLQTLYCCPPGKDIEDGQCQNNRATCDWLSGVCRQNNNGEFLSMGECNANCVKAERVCTQEEVGTFSCNGSNSEYCMIAGEPPQQIPCQEGCDADTKRCIEQLTQCNVCVGNSLYYPLTRAQFGVVGACPDYATREQASTATLSLDCSCPGSFYNLTNNQNIQVDVESRLQACFPEGCVLDTYRCLENYLQQCRSQENDPDNRWMGVMRCGTSGNETTCNAEAGRCDVGSNECELVADGGRRFACMPESACVGERVEQFDLSCGTGTICCERELNQETCNEANRHAHRCTDDGWLEVCSGTYDAEFNVDWEWSKSTYCGVGNCQASGASGSCLSTSGACESDGFECVENTADLRRCAEAGMAGYYGVCGEGFLCCRPEDVIDYNAIFCEDSELGDYKCDGGNSLVCASTQWFSGNRWYVSDHCEWNGGLCNPSTGRCEYPDGNNGTVRPASQNAANTTYTAVREDVESGSYAAKNDINEDGVVDVLDLSLWLMYRI